MAHENIQDIYPLSPLQQGMLFHTVYTPEVRVYVDCMRYRIRGPLNISAFQQAWANVVQQNDVLRTAFAWENVDQPLQIVLHKVTLPWEQHDLSGLPASEQQARLDTLTDGIRQRGFELTQAPPMRLCLIKLADDVHEFIWAVHHLLVDGWSISLLLSGLLASYAALCRGQPLSPPKRRRYRDYITWLQQQDLSAAEAFWRKALRGVTRTTPVATTPPAVVADGASRFAKEQVQLPETLTQNLQAFVRTHRLTLNTLVQGAWALLLSRYSGEKRVLFGAVVSGRPAELAGANSMIGMFINTLPVAACVSREQTVGGWLAQLQEQQVEARRFEFTPLVRVHGWSQIPRNAPLLESIVVFENQAAGQSSNGQLGITIERTHHHTSTTGYPLTLVVEPKSELTITAFYDRRRFDSSAVARILSHVQALLAGMVEHSGEPLGHVPILTTAEREELLEQFNDTCSDYPQDRCIQELFEDQVHLRPDAVAVVYSRDQLTYRELNRRANRLAYHLISLGVRPETLVGVCMERSVDTLVAVLGILKAGGTYFPLDSRNPPERLGFLLRDTGAEIIVTQSGWKHHFTDPRLTPVCLDTQWQQIELQSPRNAVRRSRPESLAYVMYTSGSAGDPKGSGVTHKAVVRLVKDTNFAKLTADEVLFHFAPLSFDASTLELWGSLLNGGRLAVCPVRRPSLEELGQVIRRHQITTLWLTAGLFHQMVDHCLEDLKDVGQILAGGDVLSPRHVHGALELAGKRLLINGYGPTENTTFTCCYSMIRPDQAGDNVSIGRPVANTQVYVVDGQFQAVPKGVAAELYTGGDGLSRGYFNRPALTAEKFLPNPFAHVRGARMYRTGDIVRHRDDGNLEFLGRRDNQVKIRGFRVELGEVEQALRRHPAVGQVVVVDHQDTTKEKRLVAYWVPTSQSAPEARDLQRFLRRRLPDYMVPSAFVRMDALPLTANGKVDRRRLPDARRAATAIGGGGAACPFSPLEDVVADVWEQVLEVPRVGGNDNFFDLGGHSLLATRVVSQLRETFRVEVTLRDLFDGPTVKEVSQRIASLLDSGRGVTAPSLQPVDRDRAAVLSFAQQRLWFVDQLEPGNAAYNIPTAVRLSGRLIVAALRASVREIVERHESLRTTFCPDEATPRPIVSPAGPIEFPVTDLSQLPELGREAEVRKLLAQQMRRSFDLSRGPLFRFHLLRLDEHEHVALVTMHHIISDEWSLGVMVRELNELYRAFAQGEPSPLPRLKIQYADFAHWQRQWMQGEVLDAQLAYWKKRLGGRLPVLKLPIDRPRPERPTYEGALHRFTVPREVTEGLAALGRAEGATRFMTILAALKTLLQRYSGADDIVVGTDVANRNRVEVEGLIGFFVNHLVLRTDLDGQPTFRQLLRRVREVTLGAYAHQDLPFDRLVSALRPQRDLRPAPLFQVLLVMGNEAMPTFESPGLTIRPLSTETVLSKYDLTLFMGQVDRALNGAWRYRTELFQARTIQRLSENFQQLLSTIVENPDARLQQLNTRSESEQRRQAMQRSSGQGTTRTEKLRNVSRQVVNLSPSR